MGHLCLAQRFGAGRIQTEFTTQTNSAKLKQSYLTKVSVMKQSSLFSFIAHGKLAPQTPVVDLFCGVSKQSPRSNPPAPTSGMRASQIGGFSCGAKKAGHRICLAVDCDSALLDTHARNHPEAEHVCVELPSDELPLPKSTPWHLHGSPPCQKLSIMQPLQFADDRKLAVDMVEWFLQLALASTCTSWTMEQVGHSKIVKRLEELKKKHPLKVDFVVVDAVNFEVPQHRRRLIAGSPFLIANLRSFRSKKRKLCVRDVFPTPPRNFIRNSLYSRPDPLTKESVAVPLKDKIRSVDKPCFTILATGHAKWADQEGVVLRHLKGHEKALLQTIPADYILPSNKMLVLVGVGNAVPPRLVEILMAPTTK